MHRCFIHKTIPARATGPGVTGQAPGPARCSPLWLFTRTNRQPLPLCLCNNTLEQTGNLRKLLWGGCSSLSTPNTTLLLSTRVFYLEDAAPVTKGSDSASDDVIKSPHGLDHHSANMYHPQQILPIADPVTNISCSQQFLPQQIA